MLYPRKKVVILHLYLLIMATSLKQPLSSLPKLAIVERFDCNPFCPGKDFWLAMITNCSSVKESTIQLRAFTSKGDKVIFTVGIVRGLRTERKFKNQSPRWSHKHDRIGIGRIRNFQFSSDSPYDSFSL